MGILAEIDWTVTIGAVVQVIVLVFGPVLAALGVWALRRWGVKLGIQADAALQDAVAKAAADAVHYAEQWAAKVANDPVSGFKPSGSEKLDTALKFVQAALGNDAVQKYGVKPLQDMIEAKLAQTINANN